MSLGSQLIASISIPHLVTKIKQNSFNMSHPIRILLLLIFSTPSSYFIPPAHSKTARLGISPKIVKNASDGSTQKVDASSDLKIFYFNQTLDHFTFIPESYMTFQQRYAIVSKHWAGAKANAPILAYLGRESSLDTDLAKIGFLRDNGPRLKALLVFIEHRYYGETMPFGSAEEALRDASTLGYLNAAQAIADYAAILLHVKEKYSTKNCPIIVIGGSYGGMLAAWFRLKYPHIALGALASSAPLLYFKDTRPKYGYYYIVTKVFKETSKRCHNTIRESSDEIDRIGAKPNGLSILRKNIQGVQLNGVVELKNYLKFIYAVTTQYNNVNNHLHSVASLCKAINTAQTDLLGQIFAGMVSVTGNRSCYHNSGHPRNHDRAWKWQRCSEMVMPIGVDKQDSMFQPNPFSMSRFIENCESYYGVPPRPHWATAYFGIQDVKLILRRFGNNIIFSNGLWDPYSVGGVLENISDTVVAITTKEGSHCQDIGLKRKEDPEWLVMQKKKEIRIIDSWISTYNRDLRDLNISV